MGFAINRRLRIRENLADDPYLEGFLSGGVLRKSTKPRQEICAWWGLFFAPLERHPP